MSPKTVFIALNKEIVSGESLDALAQTFQHVVVTQNRDRALEEMAQTSPPITAAIVGVRERIDEAALANLPGLRILGSVSAGADHLDLVALERRGIRVILAEGVNAVSVAEHALTMLLAQTKRLIAGHAAVLDGRDRTGLPSLPRELRGQRVGILGAGNTALALLRLLRTFDVEVLVWTRRPEAHPEVVDLGGTFSSLDEIISTCSALSVHLALTDETAGLLNRERLLALPSNAVVVNVSRTEIFARSCLAEVVQQRSDLMFAIDDFKLAADGFVQDIGPNGLFSPHVAGVTQESLKALQDHVVQEIISAASTD